MCAHNNKKNLTSHLECNLFGMQDQSSTRQNDTSEDLGFDIEENDSDQGENLPTNLKLNINNNRKNQALCEDSVYSRVRNRRRVGNKHKAWKI